MLIDGIKVPFGTEVTDTVLNSADRVVTLPNTVTNGRVIELTAQDGLYAPGIYKGVGGQWQGQADTFTERIAVAATTVTVSGDWNSLVNKPDTLGGFGITDAAPLSHVSDSSLHLTSAQNTWIDAITVTSTEVNYLNGASSNIQTQLNAKQAADADLTAIAALSGTGILTRTGANAWTLDTSSYITGNETITVTGDVTGSGTTSLNLTLNNSGVTAGQYFKLTVNAKGIITGGSNPTTLSGFGITDAAPLSHVSSGGSAHAVATTSTAGFLSASDKVKLDSIESSSNNYTLPVATASALGGIKDGAGVSVAGDGTLSADVLSVAGRTGAITLTSTDVGLSNVDNKSSSTIRSEITSSNVTTALGFTPEDNSNRNLAGGYAGLDVNGKLDVNQLPAIALSVNSRTGNITLTKSDVGLANVDNKSSATIRSEITSSNVTTALGFTPEDSANKGIANGYAGLDSNAKISLANIPAAAITDAYVVASEEAMLGLTAAEHGDVAIRNDIGKSFILIGTDYSVLADWQELLSPTDQVQSVNGMSGTVTITTITGNAGTATTLQTARTLTVGSTGKTFNGSSNVSWSLAEIGAQPVDADLTAIATLAGTSGFLKKTAADTWTLDTNSYALSSHTHSQLSNGTSNVNIASANGSVTIDTAGTTRLTLDTSGNVGIATGSPSAALQLGTAGSTGASAAKNMIFGDYSTSAQLRISLNNSGSYIGMGTDGGTNLIFGTSAANAGTSPTTLLTLTSTGNLGIGVSPSFKLDLSSGLTGTAVATNAVINIESQASGRDAHIRFGDGTNTAARIGYLSGDVYVYNNSLERMRIKASTGNVLIGTTTDNSRKLQVYGAGLFIDASTIQTTIWPEAVTGAGGVGTNTDHPFVLVTNGTEKLRVDTSGKVGIGLTPSTYKLEVADDIKIAVSAGGGLRDNSGNAFIYTISSTGQTKILSTGASGYISLMTGNTGNTEAVRVNASGQMGIGITPSSYALDVVGTFSGSSGVVARFNTLGSYGEVLSMGRNGLSGSASLSYPADNTLAVLINGTEKLRVSSSGNLLVGTTTDNNNRLEVVGTALFSSNVCVGAATEAATTLKVSKNLSGATTAYGITSEGTTQSGVTTRSVGTYSAVITQATAFTLGTAQAFYADCSVGAGSTITDYHGFFVNAISGPTNVRGFTGTVASGANKFNLYMSGTAKNYLEGNTLVGSSTDDGTNKLQVTGSAKVTAGLTIGMSLRQTATLTTTATTANQVITSFTASAYRSAKFLIQITSGTSYHVTEVTVIHDGTVPYITEFGTIMTGSALATFDADISTGAVRLLCTPASATSTVFKVAMTLIEA